MSEEMNSISQEDGEQSIKDRVKKQFEEGILSVMESDQFRNWCRTCGKLYLSNYSFSNAMLTFLQKPDATYVMGYEKWKEFGRQVQQGAKSIKIFAPSFARESFRGGLFRSIKNNLSAQLQKDTKLPYAVYQLGHTKLSFTMQHNGIMGLMVDGKSAYRFASDEECKKYIDRNILGKVPLYFNVVSVFDYSDTLAPEYLWLKSGFNKEDLFYDENGKTVKNRRSEFKIINTQERQAKFQPSLDTAINNQNTEKMESLFFALREISEGKGVPVTIEKIDDPHMSGYFSRSDSRIVISEDLPITEKNAVLFHEMAHADLHGNLEKLQKEMGEAVIDRHMKEVQAEAVAYITANHFGIDTSTSSFAYLASWSKGKDLKDLEKSLDVIYRESKALMKDIENGLNERGLNLQLDPIDSPSMSTEDRTSKCAENASFILSESDNQGRLKKEIFNEIRMLTDPAELDIVREQGTICDSIEAILTKLNQYNNEFQKETDGVKQKHLTALIRSQMYQIRELKANFENLSHDRIELIHDRQKEKNMTIKEQFSAEPFKTLKSFQQQYKGLAPLTDSDLSYISKSKFISSAYSRDIGTNTERYIANILRQSNNANAVKSHNGTFVEINLCENWSDTLIFQEGMVLHPKLANKIIQQAEMQIRNFKVIAEQRGEYYPHSKCDISVFTENGARGINTRIDIGDGSQKDLLNHLEQVCDTKEAKEIFEQFKESIGERGRYKDKVLLPSTDETTIAEKKAAPIDATHPIKEWKQMMKENRQNQGVKDQDVQHDNGQRIDQEHRD